VATTYELTHETDPEGVLILRASGKFDRLAGTAVQERMLAHEGVCVLNLKGIEYISSTGVAFLAKLSASSGLRIANPAECVQNILSLAGVERIMSIFPDEAAARQG
jgi:anti-anti-sigma factor